MVVLHRGLHNLGWAVSVMWPNRHWHELEPPVSFNSIDGNVGGGGIAAPDFPFGDSLEEP